MKKRVWLRGLGAICSAGSGAAEIVTSAKLGLSTFGSPKFTPTIPTDALVGEAKFEAQPPERSSRFLHAAIQEALADAKMDRSALAKAGIFLGTTSGFLQAADFETYEILKRGEPYSPRMTSAGVGSVADIVAKKLGATGPRYTFTSACTSSCVAAIEAARMIAEGDLDCALVIGFESILKTTFHGFKSMMLYDDRGCRPFDKTRGGMTLGEGAGVFILSNAPPPDDGSMSCEVIAGSSLTESHNLTAQSVDGSSGETLWQRLMTAGNFSTSDVTAIKLHATGTLDNDLSEAAAVRRLFPHANVRPPLVGLKGLLGHTLGAAGGLEIAAWTACVRHGILPKTVGFTTLDPDLGLSPSTETLSSPDGIHVLQFFGFGGSSAAIALRYDRTVHP